jgi:hypothetical protein
MSLQKSDLCTAFFYLVPCCHPLCFGIPLFLVLNALCTGPLFFLLSCLLFSPAAVLFPFLFAPLLCSVRPLLLGFPLSTATGVGPRQQRMLRCRSSSEPSVRLCRGESHSGGSLALSPLLPGRLRARLCSIFFRTHSHLFPALARRSYFASHTCFSQPSLPSLFLLNFCFRPLTALSLDLHLYHFCLYYYRLFFSLLRFSYSSSLRVSLRLIVLVVVPSGSRPFCGAISSGRPRRPGPPVPAIPLFFLSPITLKVQ